VWLPRFEYPVIVPPRDLSSAAEGAWQGVRLLIADDAVEAAETFGRLLEMDGAEVTVVGDGERALTEFERIGPEQAGPGKPPFDIVFADIGMPKMDGYELAHRLRALPSGREVPLVALTGFTRAEDVHRSDECGFDAHVGKPLSIGQITTTMQRLLVERGNSGNE
jgi:two-component system CheB/CheR fusion protein